MRLFYFYIPIYQQPKHFGATPVAYQTKTVRKFEDALMKRSQFVTREKLEILHPDTGPGGGQTYKPTMRYGIALNKGDAGIGELAKLALTLFEIGSVPIESDEEVLPFDEEHIELWEAKSHPWNEEF